MQVFFQTINKGSVVKQLSDSFTLEDFIKAASEVLGITPAATKDFRFVVSGKPLNIKDADAFDKDKKCITSDCNIFILLRLLGGCNLQDTLHTIAVQQFDTELGKVKTSTADCSICFDSDTDCIKVCCAWMCKEDFKSWFLPKEFKASCTVCSKELVLKDIFKTPEFVATLRALEEEKQLLRNMDCQRCLDCGVLLFNETMYSRQTCKCNRTFCFFCSRSWNTTTMENRQNSCGKDCVYETQLSFELVPFHYKSDLKIPSQRTCPRCFSLGSYDKKCKYHSCTSCKLTFCFLCLEEERECQKKYKSRYDHACVSSPVAQTYEMFPRLATS